MKVMKNFALSGFVMVSCILAVLLPGSFALAISRVGTFCSTYQNANGSPQLTYNGMGFIGSHFIEPYEIIATGSKALAVLGLLKGGESICVSGTLQRTDSTANVYAVDIWKK